MSAISLMLGDGGRRPFKGHFRWRHARTDRAWSLAGKRGTEQALPDAHGLARAVEAALAQTWDELPAVAARFDGLRAGWAALEGILGDSPAAASVCLVMSGHDPDGACVSAVGLEAVWAWSPGDALPLAAPGSPLLASAGLPENLPGALDLERAPAFVIGSPAGCEPALPEQVLLACGWRR